MTRRSALVSWWSEVWEATQVELQGHYSMEQLQEFEQYRERTSWLRAILVCLLTPVPCVVIAVLIDLLPLEPVEVGTWRSPNLWTRNAITTMLCGLCIMEQFRTHLPQLELSRTLNFFISFAAMATGVSSCFALSTAIGHPVPFSMVVGTVPWSITIVALIYAFKRRQFHECKGLVGKVGRYILVFACQIAMTVVYPLYNHGYKTMSPSQQTAFVFLLPVIKIVAKNWISRTLPDADNAKPEAVVFNVEIFHSLFVSLCMGNTTSSRTVLALMAVDLVQAWLSFMDVHSILRDLKPVAKKLDKIRQHVESTGATSRNGLQDLVALTNTIIAVEPFQARTETRSREHHKQRKRSWLPSTTAKIIKSLRSRTSRMSAPRISQVLPNTEETEATRASSPATDIHTSLKLVSVPVGPTFGKLPSDVASLNVDERGVLVRKTQKVLFVTEFIVLIEYTEVIVPLMYVIVVSSMLYLPNAIYYPFLEGVTTASDLIPAISNVIFYVSLEFVSLLLMGVIMWWWIRLSLVHQLAFVLERRAANIQTKLLLWMLFTVQNTVIQLGPDYTFRFEWLRHGHGAAT